MKHADETMTHEARRLYLDLMKRCLTNWIYGEAEARLFERQRKVELTAAAAQLSRLTISAVEQVRQDIERQNRFDPAARAEGLDWPPTAHTMIGLKRLENIQFCVGRALQDNIPGDLIETGVWRGGATIFMRAILKSYGIRDRAVWVADSFEGVPTPDHRHYPQDFGSFYHVFSDLAVSLEQVRANFAAYDLLDEQVKFLKGWFKDTLPAAPIEKLAVLRIDGDLYESTMEAFEHLYPKLSVGGYLIVDDYGILPPCKRAVHDYRERHGITEEIHPIDSMGIWWQRTQ